MKVRAYLDTDKDACLAVFRSNTPTYFAAHEEAEYAAFLDDLPGPYFVGVDGDAIIACGGYAMNAPGVAALCWGMVDRAHHKRGLGEILLRARLDAMSASHTVHAVEIQTSQHTQGFFERFGFVVQVVTSDGFAPGIDLVAMRLTFPER